MRLGFYPKLALTGIMKNKKTYFPYILTSLGMVMMLYIVSFLTYSESVRAMPGGVSVAGFLGLGCFVIGIFSTILLFYTNSFLIRRRKKEFGLYNILGMGKRNLARILIWETLMIAAFSILAGLGCGILFSKIAELVVANILNSDVGKSGGCHAVVFCSRYYGYSGNLPAFHCRFGRFLPDSSEEKRLLL